MMQNLTYPWLSTVSMQLEKLYRSQKFPHALLMVGSDGLGQGSLVNDLAQWLLCLAPLHNGACGHCRACCLFKEQHHPDFRHLGDNKVNISIDEVREIADFLSQASHQSGNRVVVIVADNLSVACANALLKVLEEPPQGTFFILMAKHPSAVLPTVRSRCFIVNLPEPSHAQALSWLQQQYPTKELADLTWCLKVSGGIPLKVQQITPETLNKSQAMLESILCSQTLSDFYSEDSQRWLMSDPVEALYLLYYWITELIFYVATGSTVFSHKQAEQLIRLSHIPAQSLLVFLDSIIAAMQDFRQPGVNKQLIFESLFYEWQTLRDVKNELCQLTDGTRGNR